MSNDELINSTQQRNSSESTKFTSNQECSLPQSQQPAIVPVLSGVNPVYVDA
jgi:hypothetical protein